MTTEERLAQIEEQLDEIRQRNNRVESDKAWETSPMRLFSICTLTYLCAFALLSVIGSERPWLSAMVPVAGFFLSSQSLPSIKKWWLKARYQKGVQSTPNIQSD